MRFRNILALIGIVLLGFVLFQPFTITPESNELGLSKFGQAKISDRTADHYIKKDVNGPSSEVVFNKSKNAESGSANLVTSVVVNYRSFDTLGEVTVLFLAATGLGAILYRKNADHQNIVNENASLIVATGVKILFPLLVLLGTYIFIHGHLTPGGGFQGGAVVATAFLLMFLAKKDYALNEKKFKIIESLAGITFVSIGLYGLLTEGSFLANFLDNGIIGQLMSGGIIPIIYITIGIKVGSELAGLIYDMVKA